MDTTSHLLLMALFAGCVAVVGGVLLKDTLRQQARTAAEIFGSLTAHPPLGRVLSV
jgi:hypothetical protein